MAEDRIIVEVDDVQIDMAIAKLQMATTLAQMSLGDLNVTRGAKKAKEKTDELVFTLRPVTDEMERLRYRLAQLGLHNLPSLNREARVILGTIPGMRDAMRSYFAAKREYSAIGVAITEGAIVGMPGLIIATITTLILLVRGLERRMMMMRQRQMENRRWIRQVMGMSREEYKRQLKLWEHYARSNPG